MIVHLDPSRLPDLLALPDPELRVLLAAVSLAKRAVLIDREKELAKRAGMSQREAKTILARLAETTGPTGTPWIRVDLVKGVRRIDLAGLNGLLVRHVPVPTAPPAARPVAAPRVAPPRSVPELLAAAAAEVRAIDAGLADLADLHVAHLASLEEDKQLPLEIACLQYDTVREIAQAGGISVASSALAAAIGGVKGNPRTAHRYLHSVAARAVDGSRSQPRIGSPKTTKGKAVPAAAPLRDEDLF